MADKKIEDILRSSAAMGLPLTEHQAEQLVLYYEALIQANEHVNLTAITEWDDVLVKHFMDSISAAALLGGTEKENAGEGISLIDVGTGGGFPGIPLKIALPGLQVTLMDALSKRIDFLDDVIFALGLEGIETVHSRAEDLGRDEDYREQFDYAVSRAVADMPVLSEYCTPFLKVGGVFLSYKGGDVDDEVNRSAGALEKLGCEVSGIYRPEIPNSDISRSIVQIKRVEPVPEKYPRRAGMPTKKPLK